MVPVLSDKDELPRTAGFRRLVDYYWWSEEGALLKANIWAVLYDETKDYDNTQLWSSPDPTVVGGNIDPVNLPQAMVGGQCINLYPHQHLRVNTIFEVAHEHGQTAYTDKHPAYDLVRGPSGKGLSVGYFPEIQSLDSEYLFTIFCV